MPFAERKRASQATRALVAFNQDYACAECKQKLPVGWHLDHRVPLCDPSWKRDFLTKAAATKHANAIENLQALCPNCHGRKTLIEVSEPGLAAPRNPRPKHVPWEATRARRRQTIDSIWALSSPRDSLTSILTAGDMWSELVQATTPAQLRKLHKKVEKRGRRIDYATFVARVNHLVSS